MNQRMYPNYLEDYEQLEFEERKAAVEVLKIVEDCLRDIGTKIRQRYFEIESTLKREYLLSERAEAKEAIKREIAQRYRIENSVYLSAIMAGSSQIELAPANPQEVAEYFLRHIEELSSFREKNEFIDELEVNFFDCLVFMGLFSMYKEEEERNDTMADNRQPNLDLTPKGFEYFVKEHYQSELPSLLLAYQKTKPRQKVLMLFAMRRLDLLTLDFTIYANRTEFHECFASFFGDPKEVGARPGFWKTVDDVRNSPKDSKNALDIAFHVEKIESL